MDKETVLAVIADFRRALKSAGIHPETIILYGSYATGQNRQDSDIDLVVISEDFCGKGYWERIDILSTAVYEVFKPIEAVAMTLDEWMSGNSFIVEYARNGQVV